MEELTMLYDVKSEEIKQLLDGMEGVICIPPFQVVNMRKPSADEHNYIVELVGAIPKEFIKKDKEDELTLESFLIFGIPKHVLNLSIVDAPRFSQESNLTYAPFVPEQNGGV